ncbi:single-stranded DNA-binding protein [Patescibacteria group bacterium]|nr:single-stranded DNA-binding protein [Patescibacteria group bacterium]MDE1946409.1 single-stranded DNA-binding protein [Patescibacteria group bacterium]MDE2011018.1 single-stranded DNA-binding protein [Patescibacteria group bacterium]MDE2233041.1 single-stranded DNA-binding protein [Patescibacteria group bacterium]
MYLNKVFIIGNLTRDPEIKALPSGSKVSSFGVATNRVFKNKDGVKQEMVEFHNVSAFNRLGELAGQYLRKGQQVLVEGRIQTRSWDTQEGVKKYRTEIIADNIQFGSKPTSPAGKSAAAGSPTDEGGAMSAADESAPSAEGGEKIDYPQEEINPDDIPF